MKIDMDEIFKKNRQDVHLVHMNININNMDMLNKNKTKSPKQETIEYYKLFKNEEGTYEIV